MAGVTGISGITTDKLNYPWSLAVSRPDLLYVSERANHRIQKLVMGIPNGTTVIGLSNGTASATPMGLTDPVGIKVDENGNIYVADRNNHRIQFLSAGSLSCQTVAGSTGEISKFFGVRTVIQYTHVFVGVSGNSNSLLNAPHDIALDSTTGTLYVADFRNHRVMRYLSGASSGTPVAGNNGAGTNRTQLALPASIYFDSKTNSLFIVNNDANNVVQWVLGDTSGTVVIGNTNGTLGNSSTELYYPRGITLDPMGNVYVADTVNHRIQFFLNGQQDGITIAGQTGSPGNAQNKLYNPSNVVLDSQLNFYVADTDNHRIQKFLRY